MLLCWALRCSWKQSSYSSAYILPTAKHQHVVNHALLPHGVQDHTIGCHVKELEAIHLGQHRHNTPVPSPLFPSSPSLHLLGRLSLTNFTELRITCSMPFSPTLCLSSFSPLSHFPHLPSLPLSSPSLLSQIPPLPSPLSSLPSP